ncbi:Lysophospholipid acyltransferase [Mycena kentingensis (nom. inval.)]|nr:Lysophospholipid acyltransferase [Mycena kentingensis (nom. inval.)]
MDAVFASVAGLVGASADQVKLIFCLLVAYPLGSVFIRIPSSRPDLKHAFNIAVTATFFFPVLQLGQEFFQLLGSILATFFISKYVRGRRMPWIVFVIVMGHLTVNHAIRMIMQYSYEKLEITAPQMVLAMKLTTFAWNVHDGQRPATDLDKWQMQKRVVQHPSLLEFLGYSLYFPGMLVGPYLDFAGYMELVNETVFKKLTVKGKGGRNIPDGRKRVAYRKMALGLAYLGVFVVVGGHWNFALTLTPWFVKQSMMMRIVILQFCGMMERTKYYAIWTLTEGASILTGLGFTGISPSGDTLWEGAANVLPFEIELPSNFKVLLDSWNMKTNIWLRECVYKRVAPKGKKPGFTASMLTFATSAFWHGIAGGYYLTFLTGGFVSSIARLARANFRPLVLPAPGARSSIWKRLYDVLGGLVTLLLLNYTVIPFMVLAIDSSLLAWARVAFYGHFIILGTMLFFYTGGAKFCRGLQAKYALRARAKEGSSTPVDEKTFTCASGVR